MTVFKEILMGMLDHFQFCCLAAIRTSPTDGVPLFLIPISTSAPCGVASLLTITAWWTIHWMRTAAWFKSKYLNDICFCVRVGSCYLMYVIKSTTKCHFICFFVYIIINSIIKCLPVGLRIEILRGSLYVYDFCICFRSKCLIAIERQIRLCINSIQKWPMRTDFNSQNPKQSACIFLSSIRQMSILI